MSRALSPWVMALREVTDFPSGVRGTLGSRAVVAGSFDLLVGTHGVLPRSGTHGSVGLKGGRSGPIWSNSGRGGKRTNQLHSVNRRKEAEYKFRLVVNVFFSWRRRKKKALSSQQSAVSYLEGRQLLDLRRAEALGKRKHAPRTITQVITWTTLVPAGGSPCRGSPGPFLLHADATTSPGKRNKSWSPLWNQRVRICERRSGAGGPNPT